jgi:hypothetical protein
MGLLDGSIQSLVSSAADFLMLDGTLTQESDRVYTIGTGMAETETDYAVRGFADNANQRHVELGLVERGGRIVTLLQGQDEAALSFISPGDKITIDGVTSVITGVDQDPAQATWVLFCAPAEPVGGLTGVLDGSIQSLVGSAADFLMLDMTLTQKSSRTYTPGSGVSEVETDYAVRGFVDTASQRHIELGLVERGDRVITLLQAQDPAGLSLISPGDEITVRGVTSIVKGVERDPAQATWVLYCSPGEPDGSANNYTIASTSLPVLGEDGTPILGEDGTPILTEGT